LAERLTVIIPTRERYDTLRWALKTCVSQDFDRLEILVSDNASTDGTREVVESYDDTRVRYVNPGHRLGMSEHWEFALSHVPEGYVMFLGDDDGLMPRAAAEISDILEAHSTEALIWPLASYYWPEFFDRWMANCLSMPLPQARHLSRLNSSQVLGRVAAFQAPHYLLPSPYWGVVRRSAFDRIAERSGRVFHSIIPDLYSSVAVAAVTSSYLRSDRIYSLSGVSRHSNGASHVMGHTEKGQDSKQEVFVAESGLPFHPDLDLASNVCVLVAESFLQVSDHVEAGVPRPELRALYRAAMTHPDHVLNPPVSAGTVLALRATAERSGTSDLLEAELLRDARMRWPRRAWAAGKLVALGNPLLDCSKEQVTNIYEATITADRILMEASSIRSLSALQMRGRALKAKRAWSAARERLGF
jgi:hypothetical protein